MKSLRSNAERDTSTMDGKNEYVEMNERVSY